MDQALAAGLSSGLGLLGDYFIKEEMSQRKQQRDLNDYKERLQFSNMLQQQLLEKKMQLAQQYPEYSHFVTNPRTGAVTGFTRFGAASQLQAGDPELTKLYDETKQAAIEQNKQRAQESEARLGLIGAQQGAAEALAELRQYQKNRAPASSQPKQPPAPNPVKNLKDAAAMAKINNPDLFGSPDAATKYSPELKAERAAQQQKAIQAELQKIQSGQAGLLGGGSAFGAFSNLVPNASAPSEQEISEDEEDDLLNY